MSQDASQAEIDGANGYENLLVPALLRQWCPVVLDAADAGPGHRILDVACGTGILSRAALARVGPAGSVAGVDPAAGMLAVAERLEPAVEWHRGTAESLPFPEESFDAVVSQFGLMFFADRRKALQEMVRVLEPGGRLAVAVWGALESMPAYAAEVALFGREIGEPAADALRMPFVLGERQDLVDLFESAGVSSVEVTTHTGTGRFPSIRAMVEADLRGWLPLMGIVLDEEQVRHVLELAESALGDHVTADGKAEFDLSAHVVRGSAPLRT